MPIASIPPPSIQGTTGVNARWRCAPSAFYRSADDILALSPFWRLSTDDWINKLKESEQRSEFLEAVMQRAALEQQLKDAASHTENWDTYGAPAPTASTQAATDRLIAKAFSQRTIPDSIVVSAEGGIATYFFNGTRTAFVEYRNSGEAVAVMYDADNDPMVIELDEGEGAADAALTAIGEYFA